MMQSIRVVVVEDDQLMRAEVERLVNEVAGCRCVASSHSFRHGQRVLQQTAYELAMIDLGLGDGSGLDLIPLVKRRGAKALVLTVFGDEETVVRALEAGADGYVLKDASSTSLSESIAQVIQGQSPLSPEVAGYLLRLVRNNLTLQEDNCAGLTPRETEVLEKLARGYTYREVGVQCGITYNTVAYHVKQIYEKLHANSRSEAIYKAVNGGIISMA